MSAWIIVLLIWISPALVVLALIALWYWRTRGKGYDR